MLSLSLPGSAANSSHTHDIVPPVAYRPSRPEHWATTSRGVFSLPVVTAAAHATRSASSAREQDSLQRLHHHQHFLCSHSKRTHSRSASPYKRASYLDHRPTLASPPPPSLLPPLLSPPPLITLSSPPKLTSDFMFLTILPKQRASSATAEKVLSVVVVVKAWM